MSYAARIGERLEQVTAQEVADATAEGRTGGRELVPLLAARTEEVKRTVDDWFPAVRTQSVRTGRDAEAGTRAVPPQIGPTSAPATRSPPPDPTSRGARSPVGPLAGRAAGMP
jgi:hypothetical protein